jgi:ABC-type ATPase involved in cell division
LANLKESDIPYLRRKIGIVFQDFKLLPDRSVSDNMLFVLKATGWKDKAEMQHKIDEVLDKVDLKSVADKMPHQLSGGEQQRTAIARALLNDPELILADEPTETSTRKPAWRFWVFAQDQRKWQNSHHGHARLRLAHEIPVQNAQMRGW